MGFGQILNSYRSWRRDIGHLARILHDGWRHAISAASEPARRAGSARPSISSPRKQFAFSVMSGVNPEEPLWQRPERRFRPFGRIFREKCGLALDSSSEHPAGGILRNARHSALLHPLMAALPSLREKGRLIAASPY
jgi:hypothetical protein